MTDPRAVVLSAHALEREYSVDPDGYACTCACGADFEVLPGNFQSGRLEWAAHALDAVGGFSVSQSKGGSAENER